MKDLSTLWPSALVTGASGGIGHALALRLAAARVEVVLTGRRTQVLEAAVADIERRGGRARALTMDVQRAEATVSAIRRADDELGGIDLVIANAGIGRPQPARTLSWESSEDVFATNFMGAMATLTALLPRMVERGRGHLVGISSVAVYGPTPAGTAYRATKAGLSAFLENLRIELAGTGVTTTAVHPGFVQTPAAEAFAIKPSFALRSEDAADRIVRGLSKGAARIDFPLPMVVAIRAMGWLPEVVAGPLVRRIDLAPPDDIGAESASTWTRK